MTTFGLLTQKEVKLKIDSEQLFEKAKTEIAKKLVKKENQRVFKISILKEKFVGPHWKSIDVLEYDKDEITKNDLLICDGASFLSKVHSPNMENREDYIKELNEHPYVIVVDPERIEEILDWTDYLKIHSESFRPEKFPKNLFGNKVRDKTNELKDMIDEYSNMKTI